MDSIEKVLNNIDSMKDEIIQAVSNVVKIPSINPKYPGVTSDDDGRLGYCWMHHFKCHSARSCRTWAKGGPIKEDSVSYEWQERNDFGDK